MKHILFICLGNICRSPMAEAICQALIQEKGLSAHFSVDSAGTAGYHVGKSPDRRTLQVLEKHGMETSHLGQKLSPTLLDTFDHLVVMDEANFEDVHQLYYDYKKTPPPAEKLFLIRDHDPTTKGVQEVPDPYYENNKAFENVYQILHRSCAQMLDYLVDFHQIKLEDGQEEATDSSIE